MSWKRKWAADWKGQRLESFEETERSRLHVDRVVRTTHAVDCGGGCLVEVGLRAGRIIWERPLPMPDGSGLRYCSRAPAAKTYLRDEYRILRPLVRESLLNAWREIRRETADPLTAWQRLQADGQAENWRRSRGRGGFLPADWRTADEIVAAAIVSTCLSEGSESIQGTSSGSSASLVGRASGMRFLRLLGGTVLSPPDQEVRSPQALDKVWGNGRHFPESLNWLDSELLVVCGGEPQAWMPADYPRLIEARTRGTRLLTLHDCPGSLLQHSDGWIRLSPEASPAFWRSVNRSLLARIAAGSSTTGDSLVYSTTAPLLIELMPGREAERLIGPAFTLHRLDPETKKEGAEHCLLLWDETSGRPVIAPGSPGLSPGVGNGRRSLRLIEPEGGRPIRPALRPPSSSPSVPVALLDPFTQKERSAQVSIFVVSSPDGRKREVTTLFELLLARHGLTETGSSAVGAGFSAEWFETATGVDFPDFERFFETWSIAAEKSGGRCSVICGPAILQSRHSSEALAEIAQATILSGATGQAGGGLACYSGQSRIIPEEGFRMIAEARDWILPERPEVPEEDAQSSARVLITWLSDPYFGDPVDPGRRLHQSGQPAHRQLDGDRLDLVVHLSFRLDLSSAQSDIVLPACTWYEKDELNSTGQTGTLMAAPQVVHCRGEALPEWQIFRRLAASCSILAPSDAPEKLKQLGGRFAVLGPAVQTQSDGSITRASDSRGLEREIAVAEAMLEHSCATRGRLAAQAFTELGISTGEDFTDWVEWVRHRDIDWATLAGHPRRPLETPTWTDWSHPGQPAALFAAHMTRAVPWPTRTGRQQLWPEFWTSEAAPNPQRAVNGASASRGDELHLRFRHLEDPWSLGSLFAEVPTLRQLFRAGDTGWLHPDDAAAINAGAGDWLELAFPGRKILVQCVLSPSVPRGACIVRIPDSLILLPDCPGDPLEGIGEAAAENGVERPPSPGEGWITIRLVPEPARLGRESR